MAKGLTSNTRKRKRERGLCLRSFCSNKAAPGRTICHKHHSQDYKANNPAGYHFNALRNNARRRGVPFNLTLKEFKIFCIETDYLEQKGRESGSLTIDRINREDPRGYHIDNIQVLTNAVNVRKFHAFESKGLPWPGEEPEEIEIPETPEDWLDHYHH